MFRAILYLLYAFLIFIIDTVVDSILTVIYFLCLPIITLVINIVGYFGNDYVRLRSGETQIPIQIYEHPKTGKRIFLIGTIHLAEMKYYKALEYLIDILENDLGYIVLYEEISMKRKRMSDELKDFVTVEEIAYQKAKEKLGLASQGIDCLQPKKTWINTDLSAEELNVLFIQNEMYEEILYEGPDPSEFLIHKDELELMLKLDDRLQKIIDRMTEEFCKILDFNTHITAITCIVTQFKIFQDEKRDLIDNIIVDKRDDVAFRAIEFYSKHRDGVVSIWGAAHLPGIGKKIEAMGYKMTGKVWVTAHHNKNPWTFLLRRKKYNSPD